MVHDDFFLGSDDRPCRGNPFVKGLYEYHPDLAIGGSVTTAAAATTLEGNFEGLIGI